MVGVVAKISGPARNALPASAGSPALRNLHRPVRARASERELERPLALALLPRLTVRQYIFSPLHLESRLTACGRRSPLSTVPSIPRGPTVPD